MARRRAYLAGLGTSGVLVALALLLLAVVGALLAFHGWPGSGGAGSVEGVSLDDKGLVSAAAPSFAAAAAPVTRPAAARGRGADGRSRGGRPGARQGVAVVRRTQRAGGAGKSPAAALPGQQPTSSRPAPSGAGQGVADVVKGLTGGAGEALGNPVAPAGQLVSDTGSAVSETVRQLGSTGNAETKLPKLP